MRRID
jgi:histidine phosphotransfer protein HptB